MGEYIAVKFLDEEQGTIEGLGAPYGGPAAGKDLTGEYFDKDTDFCPDWFKERPILYHHGLDPVIKTATIGKVTEWALKDAGLWVKGQLDMSNKYWSQVRTLVKAGKLYFSSGGVSHLVEKDPDGRIKRWPWVEQSLTPTPANPMAEFAFKSIIMQAGPTEAAIKALAPEIAELAAQAGIDLNKINEGEIMAGYQGEQEHNDVTGGDPLAVMKIVAAHLKEDPEYYSKIQAMKDNNETLINDKEPESMNAVKLEKPQDSPEFAPNPDISPEAMGHLPHMAKAPPAECPVKSMKCLHCGKDVTLPQETLAALQSLIESAQNAFNMGGGQAAAGGPVTPTTPTTSQTPATQPGPASAPSTPGISQGMAPENHEEGKATTAPVPGVSSEGPGPEPPASEEAASPHELAEGPAHETEETPEKEKEEHAAVKALLAKFDDRVKVAVEEATKSLKERIKVLESEPANSGPVRRTGNNNINPHMETPIAEDDRVKAIKTVMDTTDNESLKQSLGWEIAMMQTKQVIQKGPVTPNGR